jgi:hypothetical protein
MQYDDELRALAARQHNLIARSQARELGCAGPQWRRVRDGPAWTPITPQVLRLKGAAPSRGEAVLAAVLDDGGRAHASHTTGAWWWGVQGFGPRPLQIVRTSRTNAPTSLAVVHRVRELPDRWTTVLDGVPVVRPEVVILQLCATVDPGRAARALDNAWNLRLLSGPSLIALLADYGKRGRDGTALLRQLVDERGPDYVPPASNLEARAMQLFARAGLRMRRQVDTGGDAWDGRVDFRHETRPLIAEVQSERYHSALLDRAADDARRARLEAAGFTVVEITDVELWTPGDALVERLRRIGGETRIATA